MSKPKISNNYKSFQNVELAWIDRDLLNWKKRSAFAVILDEAVSGGKKVKLKKANKKKPPQVVRAEPIKRKNIDAVDKTIDDWCDFKSSLKMDKITKQKDREIMDNFLNNILLPMMKDAYVNLENLENNKYKQREALIWVLDKSSLNEWDMVEGVVYDWSDSAKKYKVLVWKDGDRVAWAYISDEDQKKDIAKWDKVYFVVVKNSSWKNVLKDYYPQEWDLNMWDTIDLQFANVKIEKLLKSIKDNDTWAIKNKKIGMGHISISLWDYSWAIKKTLLPKWYRPGKSLEVKIQEITKKGDRLLIKFDEDYLKEKKMQEENNNLK